ncbi:MAG TPA: hypothetical protein VLC92_21485 [Rhodocyclaceae bacterium]|nr:hypothetical protein [Rhodocyclaceae bacterium]
MEPKDWILIICAVITGVLGSVVTQWLIGKREARGVEKNASRAALHLLAILRGYANQSLSILETYDLYYDSHGSEGKLCSAIPLLGNLDASDSRDVGTDYYDWFLQLRNRVVEEQEAAFGALQIGFPDAENFAGDIYERVMGLGLDAAQLASRIRSNSRLERDAGAENIERQLLEHKSIRRRRQIQNAWNARRRSRARKAARASTQLTID